MGYALNRCELVFENCFVPEENVLGQEGKGFVFFSLFLGHGKTFARSSISNYY